MMLRYTPSSRTWAGTAGNRAILAFSERYRSWLHSDTGTDVQQNNGCSDSGETVDKA